MCVFFHKPEPGHCLGAARAAEIEDPDGWRPARRRARAQARRRGARRAGGTGSLAVYPSMGKGQRKRQRKRLAKLGDEARRAAKRQRQEQGVGAVVAEQQRPAEQAALIRAFHTLEKKLAAVATDPSLRDERAREAKRSALRAEQEALGGLDAYRLRC